MRGNIYISLNTETYKSKIPLSLVPKYGWTETDDDGNTTDIHPTFEQLGERNKSKFGSVIKIDAGRPNFYIVELIASWLDHEISDLLALGSGLEYPNNTLLTAEEAQQLIQKYTTETE